MEAINQQIVLAPDNIPVLSKENAASFHKQVRQHILETGVGLFEYIETIKFFAALDKQIAGDSQSKIEPDKELIDYIRTQIQNNGEKGIFKTVRGVKFEIAETGTAYDFSKCNDPELAELEARVEEYKKKLKERQELLKAVPASGMEIRFGDELVTVYPPSKSSKSSFKVSLPK